MMVTNKQYKSDIRDLMLLITVVSTKIQDQHLNKLIDARMEKLEKSLNKLEDEKPLSPETLAFLKECWNDPRNGYKAEDLEKFGERFHVTEPPAHTVTHPNDPDHDEYE